MALETLKDELKIGGFNVLHLPSGHLKQGAGRFVTVDHSAKSITFHLQNGPIKEVGVNGCQVDTLIAAAHKIIHGLNNNYPCKENSRCLMHLDKAMGELGRRTIRREAAGVEGTLAEEPEQDPGPVVDEEQDAAVDEVVSDETVADTREEDTTDDETVR